MPQSQHAPRRILVLANRLPFPVDDGWKMRAFHVMRGLITQGEVTLLVYHAGLPDAVEDFRRAIGGGIDVVTVVPRRAHAPDRLLLGLLTRTPVHVWNLRSRAFEVALDRLLAARDFDIVVSQLTYMHRFVERLPRRTMRVVDTHNIDSVVLERYSATMPGPLRRAYARMTARKLRRHERSVFDGADVVWVCSAQDAEWAAQISPRANVRIVPNGVDTEVMCPDPAVAPVPGRLAFFGKLDYIPNVDAIRYLVSAIVPRLKRLGIPIEIHLIGHGATSEIEALAAAEPMLRLIGRVEDISPVLQEATAVIVPLRMGGGTRLKILEALSLGKAVISTTIGAEGLDLVDGRDLLIADTAEQFAHQVERVLTDADLRSRLGRMGRATVQRTCDWRIIREAMVATLGDARDQSSGMRGNTHG